LGYAFGTALPETLGYMIGYNFSGAGSNDSSDFFEKAGLSGGYDDRVLGYNYFIKNSTCSEFEGDSDCHGKDKYLYMRNVPVTDPKGIITNSMVEDMADLVPDDMLKALWGEGDLTNVCTKRQLPIGSGIHSTDNKYDSKDSFVNKRASCISTCDDEENDQKRSNCKKDCNYGWWLESKCTPTRTAYTYGGTEYFDSKKKKTVDSITAAIAAVALVFAGLFIVKRLRKR
jgi:hypothetical protein